jgi:RNA polymerase sigma factor for flagellar operon FliA
MTQFTEDANLEQARKEEAQREEARREALVMDNLRQVYYCARRIHDSLPPHVLLEDLVHAGILGLIDAVRKYDPSKNVELKHYAKFRIRGAIIDSLRENDWAPRALRKKEREVAQAMHECEAELGREPQEAEMAGKLQMSVEEFQQLLGEFRALRFDSFNAETAEDSLAAEATGPGTAARGQDPLGMCVHTELREFLIEAIGELPERERRILALYHVHEMTMKEVGAVFGITESRVSQIHTMTMMRLRTRIEELMERKPAPPRKLGAGH